MNIDSNDVRPLTNFEVYDFMRKRMESKDKVRAQQTILYTGIKYFNEKSPCTVQTPDAIQSFIASMRHFNLKKPELLALINNCPTTQVELSVVILLLSSASPHANVHFPASLHFPSHALSQNGVRVACGHFSPRGDNTGTLFHHDLQRKITS